MIKFKRTYYFFLIEADTSISHALDDIGIRKLETFGFSQVSCGEE